MTTHEIAEKTKVHYQTVRRIVRALAASGEAPLRLGKKACDFDEQTTERIIEKIEALNSSKIETMKPSTGTQRREWFAFWYARLLVASPEEWERIGTVIGLIFLTKDVEFLQSNLGELRVGDKILGLLRSLLPRDLGPDSFSLWLWDAGFSAE